MENSRGKYDNDVFISYSSKQSRGAYLVRDVLTQNGLSCWMAPESIPTGSDYTNEIPPAIAGCKAVVLILTADSQQSDFVNSEIKRAIDNGKIIIPFMLTNCKIEQSFDFLISRYQRIQAFKGLSAALEELVDAVYRIIEKQNPSVDRDYLKKRLRLYRRKKTVAIIAAVVICAALIAVLSVVFSSAVKGYRAGKQVTGGTIGECTWSYDCDSAALTISGEGSMSSKEGVYASSLYPVMPWQEHMSEIKTLTVGEGVTDICNYALSEASSLESVKLPGSLTKLGSFAFSNCSSLKSISLPNAVEIIETCAFDGCKGLKELYLPDSVAEIGAYAFKNSGLSSVEAGENNPRFTTSDGCLYNKKMTRILYYPPKKTDPDFTMPETVTDVEDGAFWGCESLQSLTFSDSLQIIGDNAFSGCRGLTSVSLPDSVLNIGKSAFNLCTSIKSAKLSENLKTVGDSAFYSCTALSEVNIPASMTNIPPSMFEVCSSLTEIVIPDGIVFIGSEAFGGCRNLTSVVIPESVTKIESGAFSGCESLIITGKAGSAAESFAAEEGIEFKAE